MRLLERLRIGMVTDFRTHAEIGRDSGELREGFVVGCGRFIWSDFMTGRLQSLWLLIAILISTWVGSVKAEPLDIREAWKAQVEGLSNAMLPGAGFSFDYAGKTVGPEISREWTSTVAGKGPSGMKRIVLTHPTGLVVTREMRVFPKFGAVEYQLHFKNTSRQALPVISSVRALNLSFGESVLDGTCVVSSGGGMFDGFLPPRSFALRRSCLTPQVEYPAIVELTTEGGRSSNRDLPIFFLQNDRRQEGLFVSFGWSGQWMAYVALDPSLKKLSVNGRIPDLNIALEAGEEIQGPTVLLGTYQGDFNSGSNRLRRFVREVYTPLLAGTPPPPISLYNTWFGGIGARYEETLLRKLADGAAAIHQEYFLLDAGWYAGTKTDAYYWDFNAGLGNWYEIDREKFPHGLKAFADDVRSKGLKFGLWLEPERVVEGSRLAQEHPEWILWERVRQPESWGKDIYPDWSGRRSGLLDFGNPAVQEWVRTLLDHHIREYGIRYLRWDLNLSPLYFWDARDKPDRRGISQVRHIEGLYAVVDWLRAHHPDVVLEGCAAGGRRIDLEMARRFHAFLLSDHNADPAIVRFNLSGINHFLPGNYLQSQSVLPPSARAGFPPDDLNFQSLFAGSFGTGGRIDLWPEDARQKARRHLAVWKRLQRYLVEDYYPLGRQPADEQSWSGWQFHDPKDGSGFVQIFRTNTVEGSHRFRLRGLDQEARYLFTDAYGTASFEVSGINAMSQGITVEQAPLSSRVFLYIRLTERRRSQ